VDSGSADTWVEANLTGTHDTEVWAEIPYRAGSAEGSIRRADFEIGGHVVTDQAFSKSLQLTLPFGAY
jgi:hypothetical protein